jgi:hypothetical protein
LHLPSYLRSSGLKMGNSHRVKGGSRGPV